MIYDSFYWKEPLLQTANWLRRVRLSERTSERTYVRVEREVFVGFYSIRKLFDTLLDPEVAEAFPNGEAVNEALRSLINLAKASTRHPAF